jgi:hypothetical protein
MLDIAEWMGGLPFAELGGIIVPLLCVALGGSGIWALLSARAAGKATERAAYAAAQATERAAEAAANATERAAALVAGPVAQQATTADWAALMTFWQGELNAMREAHSALQVKVEILAHQREEDLQHIEDLEQHIWQELPPPPPLRRRLRKFPEASQ